MPLAVPPLLAALLREQTVIAILDAMENGTVTTEGMHGGT